ncbi:hypothetical protein BKA69DRAFT_696827 [Paraphysoderma sedebokerense]|nr:hypothetical protein BKA69DRAFT_695536 [Paraphysoderma sedebokerense]KAI9139056.1 hypothetical protein BKA69DRAFT_696827 [Paraphysoderma sedebokerense]
MRYLPLNMRKSGKLAVHNFRRQSQSNVSLLIRMLLFSVLMNTYIIRVQALTVTPIIPSATFETQPSGALSFTPSNSKSSGSTTLINLVETTLPMKDIFPTVFPDYQKIPAAKALKMECGSSSSCSSDTKLMEATPDSDNSSANNNSDIVTAVAVAVGIIVIATVFGLIRSYLSRKKLSRVLNRNQSDDDYPRCGEQSTVKSMTGIKESNLEIKNLDSRNNRDDCTLSAVSIEASSVSFVKDVGATSKSTLGNTSGLVYLQSMSDPDGDDRGTNVELHKIVGQRFVTDNLRMNLVSN